MYFCGTFGGALNWGIEAFDIRTMTLDSFFVYYYHLLPLGVAPGQHADGRCLGIGAEGFATVYSAGRANARGVGGGDIFFYPRELVRPLPSLVPPAPVAANGEIRRFRIPVQGSAPAPHGPLVYLALSSRVPGYGNTIVPFDTASGTLGDPVWAGSDPFVTRVSADGKYLYTLLYGSNSIRRFRLPGLEPDLEFPLLTDEGIPIAATALLNVPGAPSTTIAVERADFNFITYAAGVMIYDNGVPRAKSTMEQLPGNQFSVPSNSSQFSADGAWLFAIDNQGSGFGAGRWRITPNGFEPDAAKQYVSAGFGAKLRCFDLLCVTSSGVLFDPFTLERVRMFGPGTYGDYGSFAGGASVAVERPG